MHTNLQKFILFAKAVSPLNIVLLGYTASDWLQCILLTYLLTYIHTYILTYLLTYILTYLLTYIHTYLLT